MSLFLTRFESALPRKTPTHTYTHLTNSSFLPVKAERERLWKDSEGAIGTWKGHKVLNGEWSRPADTEEAQPLMCMAGSLVCRNNAIVRGQRSHK